MKSFFILIITLSFTFNLKANTYNTDSKMVWCTSKGVKFTEGHFEKMRRFIETHLDRTMRDAELKQFKDELNRAFMKNPLQTIESIEELNRKIELSIHLKHSSISQTQFTKAYNEIDYFFSKLNISLLTGEKLFI